MAWSSWEDWLHGLYRQTFTDDHVEQSRRLLADSDQFHEVAREMVRAWPVAAWQNLVHMWSGRNAWVGQASCLYAHAAPSAATCRAWGLLTNEQQRIANQVAVKVREEWERGGGAETLFGR